MTLTKEWLQQTIAELEEERDAIPGTVNEDAAMALAAMKLALASMTAEPELYAAKETLAYAKMGEPLLKCLSQPTGDAVIPLYTAPQAPVSAPDVLAGKSFEYIANKFQVSISEAQWILVGWNACRAAMLQGAAGNSPAHYDLRPEQNNSSPAQNPIDHGYRPDCECSGCRGLAAICSDLNGNSPVITGCWCHACRPVTMTDMRLVVCPTCGNKRCPHANDHRNTCTGSNEPGQEGSAYPAAPQQEAE